jgi:twitching motility protein PilT
MATGSAAIPASQGRANGSVPFDTNALLASLLRAHDQVSDLIFSPGRVPTVEIHGQPCRLDTSTAQPLTADDTRRIASDLIGGNKQAITILRERGSCDLSYGLPGLARFRVNVFIQRGSCAIVMRVIPTMIPDLAALGLPSQLAEVVRLRDGMVLATGPRNSGKSSTLAALLDRINQERVCHILTIEDPIEFLHNHKSATIHQRELHSDTPSLPLALHAAERQAPNVIFVSEVRDHESMEMMLQAAETGHLVLSAWNTPDAGKTLERILGLFPAPEHARIRQRLGKTLRFIVSQRLMPGKAGGGRVVAVEVLRSNSQVRQCLEDNDFSSHRLLEVMKGGWREGMQHLDGEIEKLVRRGAISSETAFLHSTDPDGLRQRLARG